jgi:acyl-coenzyme A thioesterase PaaI-like protein
MSTTYLRPFTPKDEVVTVKADLVAKTKSLLVLKVEAYNKEGKLIATSTSHSMILADGFLNS